MDNLTHTLTGLMLARAGVGGKVPRAGLLLMVAANAPDVDIVSWFGGSLTYLQYHRCFTHSLIAIPLMAAFSVGLTWLFVRRPLPWVRAFAAALIGVATHLLLDWTNVYGIRLLLPFSPEWLRLDTTGIVDLWIWLIFAIAIAAPALARLVSSEIGAKPSTGRGWAIFALVLLCGYEYGRYLIHGRAVDIVNARVYDGSAPLRAAAFPTYVNPMHWRGVVETSGAWRVFDMNVAGEFNPSEGNVFYKPEWNPAMVAASKTETFQRFLSFASFGVWQSLPLAEPEGGTEVDVVDLRFGDPRRPGFVARAIVNPSNVVESAIFSFGGPPAR